MARRGRHGAQDGPPARVDRHRTVRDELRFEVGVARERLVALVTTQVALLVALAIAVARADGRWTGPYPWVEALVALVGFLLAILAWPGIVLRSRTIRDWEEALAGLRRRTAPRAQPMPSTPAIAWGRPGARDIRRTRWMLARLVPPFFAMVWVVLAVALFLGPAAGH